jgi:hypothetical protein
MEEKMKTRKNAVCYRWRSINKLLMELEVVESKAEKGKSQSSLIDGHSILVVCI